LIHDLIKPRKFNCVSAVQPRNFICLPRWAAEFTKFAAEFVKLSRGKLWALLIRRICHLKSILLILCTCASVVGYLSIFGWETLVLLFIF